MEGLDEAMPLGWDAAAAAASAAAAAAEQPRRARRAVRQHATRSSDSRAAENGGDGGGLAAALTTSDETTSPRHRHHRSARASSVDVNPPMSPRGLDELPSAQKPRMSTKRGRDTDESDDDSEASFSDGGGFEVSDWAHSAAARRVAKRMRGGEWAGGEIGEFEAARCRQDPARRLMVEARAATLTHNLAMTMERKMAVRAGQVRSQQAAFLMHCLSLFGSLLQIGTDAHRVARV